MRDDVMRAPEVEVTRLTRSTLIVGRLAAGCIGGSILVMIGAALVRSEWLYPPVVMPSAGPPWVVQSVHVPAGAVVVALWAATAVGAAGVVAGLVAVQRGARLSLRAILITAALAVAVLTVLLPAGSTDAFDYASYGRIVVLGHSPYVWTPYNLRQVHDVFGVSVPSTWETSRSIYGPLATIVNFLAAKLGGTSVARTVLWLKVWYSAAFGMVAFVMDRVLRGDPARRLRAHLLWTVNPLLLWDLVAATHVDALAAGLGLAGILVLGEHAAARPSAVRVLAAGALIGAAAEIKITYAVFGLGLAWGLRRSPLALAQAAAAALVVLLPGYLWFGSPAVKALTDRRNIASADNFYRFFIVNAQWSSSHLAVVAAVLVLAMAVLVLRRLPEGAPARPVLRPTIALSAAFLFVWPYQLPWYEAMIICLLVFYPASRLDWLVLAIVTAGTIPNIPGNPVAPSGALRGVHHFFVVTFAPLVLLVAAIGLVALCVSGRWKLREPGGPPGTAPPETAGLVPTTAS
jgi:hypothetical protein